MPDAPPPASRPLQPGPRPGPHLPGPGRPPLRGHGQGGPPPPPPPPPPRSTTTIYSNAPHRDLHFSYYEYNGDDYEADLDTRLVRNRTEHRLAEKKSKRDVEWSDANVLEHEAEYRMTSEPGRDTPGDRLIASWPHLVIDNTALSADETAERILAWLVTDQ